MADHTSSTQETSQPIPETPEPALEQSPAAASDEPRRLNREERREVNLSHIRETILETFAAHDNRMRALSRKPPRTRRICQIILHGAHSDAGAMVAVDEPYTLIVTSNRIPAKAEEWRAGVMATLTERLGMPVHITLMKQGRFLDHVKTVSPFYEALSINHETLYPPPEPHEDPDPVEDEGPQASAEETESASKEPASKEPTIKNRNWWDAPDMRGYKAAYDREHGGLSTDDIMMDMEEPIVRLNDAAVLLTDLAYGGMHDVPPRAKGLDFIAQALTRDARLLYRLYNGRAPNYL